MINHINHIHAQNVLIANLTSFYWFEKLLYGWRTVNVAFVILVVTFQLYWHQETDYTKKCHAIGHVIISFFRSQNGWYLYYCLWVRLRSMHRCTENNFILNFSQRFATDRLVSPGTMVTSINRTNHHYKNE
jgi:hypothetical protein